MKTVLFARARRCALFAVAVMAAAVAYATPRMGDNLIVNGGFETGSLSPWVGARVNDKNGAYNPSSFCIGNYCGVIQQNENMLQTFSARAVTRATLTWKYARRTSWGNCPYFTVYFDGEIVRAEEYISDSVTHTGTLDLDLSKSEEHTLKFQGRANGDSTFFIDEVVMKVTMMDETCLFITNAIAPIVYGGSNNTDRSVYEPKPIVTDPMGLLLEENLHYTLSYSNNVGVGTATVVAHGVGKYAGNSDKTTFQVLDPMVSEPVIPSFFPSGTGCTPLKSITSTGTQWINTGIVPGATTAVEMDFNTGTYVHNTVFFGQSWAGDRYLFNQQSGTYYFHSGGQSLGSTVNNMDAHISITDDNKAILTLANGRETSANISRNASGEVLGLFSGVNGSNKTKFSLYNMQIRQGGKLVRDFIPALRNSNGAIGVYDKANGKFYGNSGSGAFVAGAMYYSSTLMADEIPCQILQEGGAARPEPVVYAITDTKKTTPLVKNVDYKVIWEDNESPGYGLCTVVGIGDYAAERCRTVIPFELSHSMYDYYDTVEFLQSDGNQRINTGKYFYGNHTFHYIFRQARMDYMTCGDKGWGCSYDNNNWNYAIYGGGRKNNWNDYKMYYNNCYVKPYFKSDDRFMLPSSWAMAVIPSTNVIFHETCRCDAKIRIRMQCLDTGQIFETDPSIDCANGTNFVSKAPICLFGDYYDAQRGKKALYGCRMVNDLTGEVEWELTPAVRLKDRKPGLYDFKANKFYTNIDSGEFTYGPVTGPFTTREKTYVMRDNQPIDPVSETCVNRHTGVEYYRGTDYEYVISNNAAPGTARIYFRGLGNFEGRNGFSDFQIVDGGMTEKERYKRLSRAYARAGLVCLYDAADNTGTGEHDPDATMWKDLGPYGLDAVVGECSFWANSNALRTTTAPSTAGIIPVAPPLRVSQLLGGNDVGRTIEMRYARGDNAFTRMRLYENFNSDTYCTFFDVLEKHQLYWYSRSSTERTYSLSHYWDMDQGQTTITAEIDDRYMTCYVNGFKVNEGSMDWTYTQTGYPYTFGGCKNTPARTFIGDMHCIRTYTRKLTARDIKYNMAIDRVRFEGVALRNALPATLPDGYYYNPTSDFIDVKVCLNALTSQGRLRVNDGADLVKLTNVVVALGTELKVEYVPQDGEELTKWYDLPGVDASYPDAANTNVLKLVAWGPISVSAVSPLVKAEDTLPARTYVPKGLVGQWDGIDNLNEGRPATGATRWEDLTGKAHPWYQYNGSYNKAEKGMNMSQGRCSFYYKDVFPDYRTIEMSVKMTGGSSSSVAALYLSKNDYNRNLIGYLNIKGVAGQALSSYWPPCYAVTDFFTSTQDNTLCNVLHNPASSNPCDDYFYINGAGRSPNRTQYTDISITGWSYHYLGGADHSSQNHYTASGIIHALRVYDRELTQVEAAFNAAVDRVRFYGAAIEDVFPYVTLPDGYRWNAADRRLEVRFTVGEATRGTLTPAPGTVAWYPVGASVTVSFAPGIAEKSFAFKGVPTNATYDEEGTTATFPIACPTEVSAACEQVLPARTYVRDGLYNHWDGIDNVNLGDANHSDGALKWHDLCQHSQYPWELYQGRARFTKNAFRCIESTYSDPSAILYNLLRTFRTLEICTRPTATYTGDYYRHILANRETRQQMHINTGHHKLGSSYINTYVNGPAVQATNVAGNVWATYAAVWNPTNFTVTGYAVNGRLEAPNATFDASGYVWFHSVDQGAGTYASQRRYPALGARWNTGNKYFGDIHAIRCYDRPLSARELAFNAAVDRVRFLGAHPRDEFPKLTLPDGYRWNNTKEQLEVLVSCSVSNGLGKVSLNGATEARSASGYFPCGETVSFTAIPNDGRIVRDWHGLYGFKYESADYATVSFVAASPSAVVVETVPGEAMVPFSTYLQEGLVNAWDALEQPGDDKEWFDLKEKTQMSLAQGTARWQGHAFRFDGQTYLKGYVPNLRQALKDKALTVQLFLRPQSFTYDSGYFSMGESQRYRALMLGMNGQQWYDCRAQTFSRQSAGGAFGMLFYCYDSQDNNTSQYYSPGDGNFVVQNTDMYFGRDTLATLTRDASGNMRLYLDDNDAILVNTTTATGNPQSEFTCFGAWYGGRCSHYDLYAFRIYDRALTRGEIRINGLVDRLRFLGDASGVSETEGLRYRDGKLYARLAAYVDDPSRGGVAFTNETPAASCAGWAEVGTTVTVRFRQNYGYIPLAWSNAPASATYSGAYGSISFVVSEPVTNLTVLTRTVEGVTDAYFTSTHALPNLADTKKTVGNRTMYWFTNLTAETVYMTAAQDLTIEAALVVGGGGAGGCYIGGGGGGGGVVELAKPVFVPRGGAFFYKVGAGGVRRGATWPRGNNGTATVFGVDGFSATAHPGGGGGGHDSQGTSWTSDATPGIGCGGGCARGNGVSVTPNRTYTPGQGWWGGSGVNDHSGGGGGADGPGRSTRDSSSQSTGTGGDGGPGRLTFLTGAADQFGSGGGGGARWDSRPGTGGKHAGKGGIGNRVYAGNGEQGYGAGGGGGDGDGYGGSGSSGCVILSIRAGDTTAKPLTVTLASTNVLWTGSAVTPAVTVKDWNGNTVSSGNYTLTWFTNTDPGTGCVRVNGTGGTVAGLTAEARFMIHKRFYAACDGEGNDSNDGSSWSKPKTLAGAVSAATAYDQVSEYTRPEVWCKAGTINRTAAINMTRRIAIRGGYKGDGDKLADDPITWIVGNDSSCNEMLISQASCERGGMVPAVFQRLGARRGKYRCFWRDGQTGAMEIRDCRFTARNGQQQFEGRGLRLNGNAYNSTLYMSNCVVEGCVATAWVDRPVRGGGAWFANWKQITMDSCLFVTNGMLWESDLRAYYDYDRGAHIFATDAPIVARNCEFRAASMAGSYQGGMIILSGNCGGSAFENCAFVGNQEHPRDWSGEMSCGGCIYVDLGSGVQTLDLLNCTFAYNVVGSQYSAACLTIYSGTVNAKNCIFYNNTTSTDYANGTDVQVRSGRGHFNCDWSMIGGRDTSFYNAIDGGTVSLGQNCIVGENPLFVTDPGDVTNLLNSGKLTYPRTAVGRYSLFYKRNIATRDAVARIDVHLRTPEVKAGQPAFEELSPAIDAADPADDWSKEPGKNGRRRNMGAYGGSAEAEQTPDPGEVQCTARVEYRGDSEPVVNLKFFTLPKTVFNAAVTVECGLSKDGPFDRVRTLAVRSGTAAVTSMGIGYLAGTKYWLRITATVAGQTLGPWYVEETAEGDLPRWQGHGGDSNRVIHVRGDAVNPTATGTSWEDALSDFYEAVSLLTPERNEIWVSGALKVAKDPGVVAFTAKTFLRGGFDGSEDDPSEREPGARATVDGQNKAYCLIFTNTKELTLDGILFTRGSSIGVRKKASAGDLIVTNCGFTCSGSTARWGCDSNGNYDWSYESGGGANFIGTSAATLRVYDSDFSGNRTTSYGHSGSGGGAAIATWQKVWMDHCNFETNFPAGGNRGHACGLHFYNAPFEMTRTRFRGNYISCNDSNAGSCGCIFAAIGACGDSIVRSCVFSGNHINDTVARGIAYLWLSDVATPITFENCTFGYNLCGPATALGVGRGTVTARNCIFFGNGVTVNRGADIYCYDAGVASVTRSLFASGIRGDSAFYWSAANNDRITVDTDSCTFADPLFVSDTNAFMIATGNATFPVYASGKVFSSRQAGQQLDVHLRSHGGTTLDDGTVRGYEDLVSPCLDVCPPDVDILDEPYPNGNRRNLGGYGGTPEAAYTPTGKIAIDDSVSWLRATDFSQPTVYFTLGGEGFYTANAVISVSTDGYNWTEVKEMSGLSKGDTVSYEVPYSYPPGSTLYVKVVATANEKTIEKVSTPKKIWGEVPFGYGKGGNASKVVHVRADATGKSTGDNWWDAVTSLEDAYTKLSYDRNEIWIAGDLPVVKDSVEVTFKEPVTIRGGFRGDECRIEERDAPDAGDGGSASFTTRCRYTTMDGQDKYRILQLKPAVKVRYDRIRFTRGYPQGVYHTGGGGDLTFESCCFENNGWRYLNGDLYGRGFRGTGTSATTLAFTNCVFSGNMMTNDVGNSATEAGRGHGMCIYTYKRVYIDGCDFVSNGAPFRCAIGYSSPGRDRNYGAAIFSEGAPITARNTSFRANRCTGRNVCGGIVYMQGASYNSGFTNCVWVGNEEVFGWYDRGGISDGSSGSGCIYVTWGATANPIYLDHCTFAYNLCDNPYSPAALHVRKGTAIVRNCVFTGNMLGTQAKYKKDIVVNAAGALDVDYTLFDGPTSDSITIVSGGVGNIGSHVIAGASALVTPYAEVTNLVVQSKSSPYLFYYNQSKAQFPAAAFNAHLRSLTGYWDPAEEKLMPYPGGPSAALDAADPSAPYDREPLPNGKRANLGAYGNTPYSTRSRGGGRVIFRSREN